MTEDWANRLARLIISRLYIAPQIDGKCHRYRSGTIAKAEADGK